MERKDLQPPSIATFNSFQDAILTNEQFAAFVDGRSDIRRGHTTEAGISSASSSIAAANAMKQSIISKFHQRKLPTRTASSGHHDNTQKIMGEDYHQWQSQENAVAGQDGSHYNLYDYYSYDSLPNRIPVNNIDRSRMESSDTGNHEFYIDAEGKPVKSPPVNIKLPERRNLNELDEKDLPQEFNTKAATKNAKVKIKAEDSGSAVNDAKDSKPEKKRRANNKKKTNNGDSQQEEQEQPNFTNAADEGKANPVSSNATNEVATDTKVANASESAPVPEKRRRGRAAAKSEQSRTQLFTDVAKMLRNQAKRNGGQLSIRSIKHAVGIIYNALGYTCKTGEVIQLMKNYKENDDQNDTNNENGKGKRRGRGKAKPKQVPTDANDDSNSQGNSQANSQGKRKRRRKSKKEKNDPTTKTKRPLSGYNLFFKVERDRLVRYRQMTALQQHQQESHSNGGILDATLYSLDQPYTIEEIDLAAKASKLTKPNQSTSSSEKESPAMFGYGELARIIGSKWKELNENDKKMFESYASTEQLEFRSQRQQSKEQVVHRKRRKRADDQADQAHDVATTSQPDQSDHFPLSETLPTTIIPKGFDSYQTNNEGWSGSTTEQPSFYQLLLWEQQRRMQAQNNSSGTNIDDSFSHTKQSSSDDLSPSLPQPSTDGKHRYRTGNKSDGVSTNQAGKKDDDEEYEGADESHAERISSMVHDDISLGSINTVESSSNNVV